MPKIRRIEGQHHVPRSQPTGGGITPPQIDEARDRFVEVDGHASRLTGADVLQRTFRTSPIGRVAVSPAEVQRAKDLATQVLITAAAVAINGKRQS